MRRSAKQRAATKRLISFNRNRRKTIRAPNTTKSAMRRKSRGRSRRIASSVSRGARSFSAGRSKFGGFLKKGIVGDVSSALGSAVLVGAVTDRVAPQFTPYAQIAAEYAAGGVTGMVAAEGLKSILGMPSILSGVLGQGLGFLSGSQQQGPTGGAL